MGATPIPLIQEMLQAIRNFPLPRAPLMLAVFFEIDDLDTLALQNLVHISVQSDKITNPGVGLEVGFLQANILVQLESAEVSSRWAISWEAS